MGRPTAQAVATKIGPTSETKSRIQANRAACLLGMADAEPPDSAELLARAEAACRAAIAADPKYVKACRAREFGT